MRVTFVVLGNLFIFLRELLRYPFRRLGRSRGDVVALELTGDLPWREARARQLFRFNRARSSPLRATSMKALDESLRNLEEDPAVRGVVVKVEGFGGSGAKLAALRRLVQRLRARGKEAVFYGRAVEMREYTLMSAGSRIQMAPGGHVDLAGAAAELYVLGGTFEKLGVKAHFIRRGEYKTAPELFTEKEVSPAQKRTTEALLSESYDRAVGVIAENRGKTPEQVRGLVDEGPYSSSGALGAGLIDAIGDGEDLETLLAPAGALDKKGKPKKARLIPLASYPGSKHFRPKYRALRRKPRIALVPLDGVIKLGESVHMPLSPRAAGSDSVVKALRLAREDDGVKAILLHVESRGGSALASELIHKAVVRAAQVKPVLCYVEQIAASGGYMAAVGATHVMVAPQSIVGSIGVFGGKFEISSLLERLGVGRATLRFGKHSAMNSSMEPWSADEKATLEKNIEDTYQDFLRIVAEGRKLTVEQVHALGEGRVFSGTRAKDHGLVDSLGDFEEALLKVRELAKLSEEPEIQIIELSKRSMLPFGLLRGPNSEEALAETLRSLASERIFAFDAGSPLLRL